jgi:hypothetical protein
VAPHSAPVGSIVTTPQRGVGRWRSSMSALTLPCGLAVASLLGAGLYNQQPTATGPVAAVFPPWWAGTHSMAAAGQIGAVVRFGAFPFVVVVVPEGENADERLRRAGAWLVLDPLAFGACGLAS